METQFIRSFLSFTSSFIASRGGWKEEEGKEVEEEEEGTCSGGVESVRIEEVNNQGVIR